MTQNRRVRARSRILASALALLAGCGSVTDGSDPAPQTSDVSVAALTEPAAALVFKYRLAAVNADSVLRVLVRAHVPISEAWLPLEDLCMDPIGPRFTVVLSTPYARMADFDFEPGNGIRACTVRVRRYVVRR